MIEYAKQILPKVCNWKDLFRKELIKCIEWAEPANRPKIYDWCFKNYCHLHEDVLEDVYQNKIGWSCKGDLKIQEDQSHIGT